MISSRQPQPARLRSVKDGSRYLGISPNNFRGLLKAGELPHIRIGARILVDMGDLDQFITAHRQSELREGARA